MTGPGSSPAAPTGTAGVHEEVSGWWMPDKVWEESKGRYAESALLEVHFDDQVEYKEAFWPYHCFFVNVVGPIPIRDIVYNWSRLIIGGDR